MALTIGNGLESVIVYEALLRSLFSTSPATGLCLYDRRRMPLQVVNGALLTHPVVEVAGTFAANDLYDPTVTCLSHVDSASGQQKRRLALPGRVPTPRPRRIALT